jgi:non-heme chloroperoxidase
MGEDVFAVMDALGIERAAIIGWSDGACTGLVMAKARPQRIAGLFFFACNVDASGTLPFHMSKTIGNCLTRLKADYAAMSPEPERFDEMSATLQVMQGSQPDYSAEDLAAVAVPIAVTQAERDQFIRPEHARYIAATIPGAEYVDLPGVSHFAMMQRPALFNTAMLEFLARIGWQP